MVDDYTRECPAIEVDTSLGFNRFAAVQAAVLRLPAIERLLADAVLPANVGRSLARLPLVSKSR